MIYLCPYKLGMLSWQLPLGKFLPAFPLLQEFLLIQLFLVIHGNNNRHYLFALNKSVLCTTCGSVNKLCVNNIMIKR